MTSKSKIEYLRRAKLEAAAQSSPVEQPESATRGKAQISPASRRGLKHIGGYFDDDVVEKVALLRVRLKKDNSELIKLAIEDLYHKHMGKRAFGG
jgi:hypothetical protein